MARISLTEVLDAVGATKNWWSGRINKHFYVLPVDDIAEHFTGSCLCNPEREWVNGHLVITHNAFDGRE